MKKISLEFDINHYKMSELLGIWHDEDEKREQRRRLWMLRQIQKKEDKELLKQLS